MKNKFWIGLVPILFVLFSCTVVPKKPVTAKRKINKLKERIENISSYHGFDSVWYEKKKIVIPLPEIKRKVSVDFNLNKRVLLDSVIVTKDSIVRDELINQLLDYRITYSDSVVDIHVLINPSGYDLLYRVKEKQIIKQTETKVVKIDSGLKYYQQRPFWIIVLLLSFIIFYLLYLLTINRR